MKQILVTGANKGIGYAVVEQILRDHPDYGVILGSRNEQRGQAARAALLTEDPSYAERLSVLTLDVGSSTAIEAALASLAINHNERDLALCGLVNNAGTANCSLPEMLDVNVRGVRQLTEHFAPRMAAGARIVNVTSASAPNFVARCDAERQQFFLRRDVARDELDAFMADCESREAAGWAELGMYSDSCYGLSKACANTYTLEVAGRYPALHINACTPGFIETDLGREFLGERTPAEAGMKTPAQGARVIIELLFADGLGTGHYYGSDARRSPLDRYRAPGSPPYSGD